MAFTNLTNEAVAIMQIQRILRELELYEQEYSSVPLSGIFENETRGAVADFQSKYGISPTGVVDYETWLALHSAYNATRLERKGVRRVALFPPRGEISIFPDEKNDIVYVIQYMLSQISTHYNSFEKLEFTGIYDEPTQSAIREFQRKNLIESNGIIDPSTLEALFEEYEGVILERG